MPTTRTAVTGRWMSRQIPFPLSGQEHATFENFFATEKQPLLSILKSLGSGEVPRLLYLWGGAGSGKSHLLHACCSRLEQQGVPALYLPLKLLSQQPSDRALTLLEGLSSYRVFVVDDLQQVVGERNWEEMLFHLLNQARDQQQVVVMSGRKPFAELGIGLPDLRSRLGEAVVEQLQPLSGEEKWSVLQQRAGARGMEISDEVVNYLIKRTPRDFHALFRLLDDLDQETLVAQRRITIPFVKELLDL